MNQSIASNPIKPKVSSMSKTSNTHDSTSISHDNIIRIRFNSYTYKILTPIVTNLNKIVQSSGGHVKSVVYAPAKRIIETVLRGPHIDKKSRQQFEYVRAKVTITIQSNAQTRESLKRFITPANVGVQFLNVK